MAQPPATLQPPIAEKPIADDGNYSQIWTRHQQSVVDRLAALPAEMRKGVTDGSDATAGDIGEYLTATSGSVALTNAALANVVSLDLTAGDWDVSGNVVFSAGTGTHSLFGAGVGGLDTFSSATFPSVALNMGISTATHRYNVTAMTTVWVVAEAGFTGTCSVTGIIRARRVR
jgi:hypothetical protein